MEQFLLIYYHQCCVYYHYESCLNYLIIFLFCSLCIPILFNYFTLSFCNRIVVLMLLLSSQNYIIFIIIRTRSLLVHIMYYLKIYISLNIYIIIIYYNTYIYNNDFSLKRCHIINIFLMTTSSSSITAYLLIYQ